MYSLENSKPLRLPVSDTMIKVRLVLNSGNMTGMTRNTRLRTERMEATPLQPCRVEKKDGKGGQQVKIHASC
jgi:hypothetical protein